MVWLYRKSLTINSSLTPGALTNFPLYVSTAADSDLTAHAQADGDDIAFFASDGTTQLEHELESYVTGTLRAHVLIPSLAATGNPVIYMYYGDAGLGAQEDPASVWVSSYVAVYHLGENPGGTAPQMLDSTSNARHATANGGMVSGDSVAAKIGNGLTFNGEHLTCPNAIMSTLSGAATWQMSCWLQPSTATTNYYIMGHGQPTGTAGFQGFNLAYRGDIATDPMRFFIHNGTDTQTTVTVNGAGDLSTQMNHLVMQVTRAGNVEFFVNDTSIGTADISAENGGSIYDSGRDLMIARQASASATSQYVGILDEIRFSTGLRNSDWRTAEYNNQNNPGTFITIGSEESLGGSATAASYYYRMSA